MLAMDMMNGRGLSNATHHKCQPKNTKVADRVTQIMTNGEWVCR